MTTQEMPQQISLALVGPQARPTILAQKIALVEVVQLQVEAVQELLHQAVNNVHSRLPLS